MKKEHFIIIPLIIFSFFMGQQSARQKIARKKFTKSYYAEFRIWQYEKQARKYEFLFKKSCNFCKLSPMQFEKSWYHITNAYPTYYPEHLYFQ